MNDTNVTAEANQPVRAFPLAKAVRAAFGKIAPWASEEARARLSIRLAYHMAHDSADLVRETVTPLDDGGAARRQLAEACYDLADMKRRNETLNAEAAMLTQELRKAREEANEAALEAAEWRDRYEREHAKSAYLLDALAIEAGL